MTLRVLILLLFSISLFANWKADPFPNFDEYEGLLKKDADKFILFLKQEFGDNKTCELGNDKRLLLDYYYWSMDNDVSYRRKLYLDRDESVMKQYVRDKTVFTVITYYLNPTLDKVLGITTEVVNYATKKIQVGSQKDPFFIYKFKLIPNEQYSGECL